MDQNNDRAEQHTADVSAQRIAKVYAEALLNAAEAEGQADAVQAELEALVREVFKADPQLEGFFGSGAVGRNRRAEVIRHVFEGRAGGLFLSFLLVLNEHERLDLIRPVLTVFRALRDQRARRIRVRVQTAVPLSGDHAARLERELRETFRLEPVLETAVEPTLLGGMVVRVGDWLYDASVRTRLQTIRNQLIERSSHEIQSRRDRFSSTS